MARTHYDYIIAGAGCAGLGLVWKLLRSPLRGKSILILDPDGKTSDDRTWCFWDSAIPDLPCPPSHSWQKISVHTDAGSHVHGIAPYHYHHLSGKEYYDSIHALLEDADQVDWRQEAVLGFESLPEGVTVTTTGGQYHAGWVFSSLPVPAREERSEESMFQHFLGYFIETERDVFDPAQVHLMDFRVTQEQDIRFFYLLPFSPGKALIEFTVFSDEVWEQDRYVPFLDAYLEQLSAAGSGAITITHQEQGVIPMNTRPEKIWRQPGVMNLGIAGGAARPGTGYAFQFIQERNQQIVDSLIRYGRPIVRPHHKKRHGFYDALLLRVMRAVPGRMPAIFQNLFNRHRASRVLAFLSEQSDLLSEIQVLVSLPWPPFLTALMQKIRDKRRHSPTPDPVFVHNKIDQAYAHRQS